MDTERVYTLEDLRRFKNEVPKFAVLGQPIAHSLSPQMHNKAFQELSRERFPQLRASSYFRFEISPEALKDALPLFLENGFKGLNLTIPHKVKALSFLSELSQEAKIIGAANTLIKKNNSWCGHNTDGEGFSKAVEMQLGRNLKANPILLLGAGGAARAIATTALMQDCGTLTIANRSRERAEELAQNLRKHFPHKEILIRGAFHKNEDYLVAENSLIVNTTPLGLKIGEPSPLPEKFLRKGHAVYDTTYGNAPSELIKIAQSREIPAADGRAMLAWQGALASALWNNVPAETLFPPMFAALH